MTTHRCSLRLTSDPENFTTLMRTADQFLVHHQLARDDRHTVLIVLEEVVLNIMSQDWILASDRRIAVRMVLRQSQDPVCRDVIGELDLEVSDDGAPFNPLNYPEPDLTSVLAERPVGGLGIHLVRHLMDRLQYQRVADQNILILTKRLDAMSGIPDAPEGGRAL